MHIGCQRLARPVTAPRWCGARAKAVARSRSSMRVASGVQKDASVRVYVSTLPLVGWEGLEATLRSAFPDSLALHSMILLEEPGGAVTVYDFLPKHPRSPAVAATLLAGGSVKGELRERQLQRRPTKRCWLLGPAKQNQVE